jgi:hypothetical protein
MNNFIYSFILISILALFGCSSSETINSKENNQFGLTQEQFEFVKNETVPEGKLDFEKQFPSGQLVILDDVAYNKKSAALYTWALAIKKLGVQKAEDAIALYEQLQSVKLRDSQKKAMENAYNKK